MNLAKNMLKCDKSFILKDCGKNIVELSGVKSNPTYEQVLKSADLVREHNIDLILAVGGKCNRLPKSDFRICILRGRSLGEILGGI